MTSMSSAWPLTPFKRPRANALTRHWSVRICKGIKASLLLLLVMTGFGGVAAQSPSNQPRANDMELDVAKVKEAMLGNWESIAPEIRPSKNPDGSLKPFYLKRAFKYLPSDRFELEIVNSADPYGAVPLARIKIGGHMQWLGPQVCVACVDLATMRVSGGCFASPGEHEATAEMAMIRASRKMLYRA